MKHSLQTAIGGRLIFQLFEKQGHIRGTNEYLYGVRFAIDTPGIYPKLADEPHVIMLNESTSNLFINRLIQTVSDQKVQHLRKDIRHLHQHLYAFPAPPEIENRVVTRYVKHLDDGKPEFESLVRAFDDLKDI